MNRILFFLIISLVASLPLSAQELLCNVSIDASRIQSDRSVFEDMQKNISEYLNFQAWGPDKFEGQERIRCNLQIIIQSRPTPDRFEASMNLQVYRPTFNTTYESVLLNLSDRQFDFNYVAFQPLTFVDNTYNDNLTALLNYYAFIILGFDYDSFGQNAGMPFFRKAQEIVNMASSASTENGWRANQNDRNRYWLVEGLMNSRYKGFHDMIYKYHRQGLDQFEKQPAQARRAIVDVLKELQRLHRQDPRLYLKKVFLDAKQAELVKIFTAGFVNDKKEFIQIMQDVDPSNMNNYNAVNEGK